MTIPWKQIETDFDLSGLAKFAKEDVLKGEDKGDPYGTSFTDDGRLLYALVRALGSEAILEIGTHHGGSANHLAAAVKANGGGMVTTLDISGQSGRHILPDLQFYVRHIVVDANLWIPQTSKRFDFIFEDGNHSEFQVHVVYENLSRILEPGGFIVSHDALVEGIGDYIRNGIRKGGVNLEAVKFYNTSPVGLSIYRRPL